MHCGRGVAQTRVFPGKTPVATLSARFDSRGGRCIESAAFKNFDWKRSMKTFSAKPHEVKRDWFVVDGTDKVLGRLAAEVDIGFIDHHNRVRAGLEDLDRKSVV